MNDSSDEIFENTPKSERTVDVVSKENQGSKTETGDTITAEFDRFFFDNLSDGKLRKLQDKIDEFLKVKAFLQIHRVLRAKPSVLGCFNGFKKRFFTSLKIRFFKRRF